MLFSTNPSLPVRSAVAVTADSPSAGKRLPDAVTSADDLSQVARSLLEAELAEDRLFRLVGVGVSGFEGESDEPEEDEAQPRLL